MRFTSLCNHWTLPSIYPLLLSILSNEAVVLVLYPNIISMPDNAHFLFCFSYISHAYSGVISSANPLSLALLIRVFQVESSISLYPTILPFILQFMHLVLTPQYKLDPLTQWYWLHSKHKHFHFS